LKQIYLDHNATTNIEQGAERALLFFSSNNPEAKATYGNPSSIHWAGRAVKSAVDDARDQVAEAFGINDSESICFTGSATESINTALKGLFFCNAF
jgi:cysteine desulfurase